MTLPRTALPSLASPALPAPAKRTPAALPSPPAHGDAWWAAMSAFLYAMQNGCVVP